MRILSWVACFGICLTAISTAFRSSFLARATGCVWQTASPQAAAPLQHLFIPLLQHHLLLPASRRRFLSTYLGAT